MTNYNDDSIKTIGQVKLARHSSIILIFSILLSIFCTLLQPGAVLANPSWVLQEVVLATGTGRFSSIALDSKGYPHLCYRKEPEFDLQYTRWNGTSWDTPTPVDTAGDVGAFTSIAIDSADNPHISYYNATHNRVKYASYDGTLWSTEFVDVASTGMYKTSLRLDGEDHPHISYTDSDARDLKYAHYDGAGWQITVVDSAGEVGYYSSLALDSNDNPHISYLDWTNQKLKYAYYDSSGWHFQSPQNCAFEESVPYKSYTSLQLDSNGYPHISYYDSSGKDLMYTKFTGTVWTNENIDSQDDSGGYNSLALDSNDHPHISYFYSQDITHFWLAYAYHDGTSWQIQNNVVWTGGQYTDIVVDEYNRPHISYYHSNSSNCRYARLNGVPGVNTVSPGNGSQGQTISVTITGYSFIGTTSVGFSGPDSSVIVNSYTVIADTQITASVTIASDATPGTRNVTVTTPDGTGILTYGFTVNTTPLHPSFEPYIIGSGRQPGSSGSTSTSLTPPTPPVINSTIVIQSASLSRHQATGQWVTVNAIVANTSTVNGIAMVKLYINGQVEESRTVAVGSGRSVPLTFKFSRGQPGTYSVYVNSVKAGSYTLEWHEDDDIILYASLGMIGLSLVLGITYLVRRRPHGY